MNSIFNHFQVPRQLLMIAFFVFISAGYLNAQHDDHGHQKTNGEDWEKEVMTEESKAGEMIIEHIVDSYEWHIITIGHTHVTIPLPVMLYDEGEFHFFMSSVFHHHDSYEGYYLSHNDMNTGKIVRKDANGNEVRPTLDFSFTKNVLAIFLSSLIMIWIFTSVAKMYKRRAGQAPKGLQSLLEPLIIFIRDDIAKASIGEKNIKNTFLFC